MTNAATTNEEATNTSREITEADVEQYMTSLSNWGRWGEDDRLGTLNLITDEARLAAAQTIKTGKACLTVARHRSAAAPTPWVRDSRSSNVSWGCTRQATTWKASRCASTR